MTTSTSLTTPPNVSITSSTNMTTSSSQMTTSPTKMTTSPTKMTTSSRQATSTTPAHVFDGPITRSRAMKLQQEVHTLICEFHFNIDENYILTKSCMLLLLSFTKENDKDTPRMNQRDGPRRASSA
jgi:predicted unusual protein kinase regulating ubiquinone biosynthesis (AarF/ABC1/UbiB family)